jgi:hypothetical protein
MDAIHHSPAHHRHVMLTHRHVRPVVREIQPVTAHPVTAARPEGSGLAPAADRTGRRDRPPQHVTPATPR